MIRLSNRAAVLALLCFACGVWFFRRSNHRWQKLQKLGCLGESLVEAIRADTTYCKTPFSVLVPKLADRITVSSPKVLYKKTSDTGEVAVVELQSNGLPDATWRFVLTKAPSGERMARPLFRSLALVKKAAGAADAQMVLKSELIQLLAPALIVAWRRHNGADEEVGSDDDSRSDATPRITLSSLRKELTNHSVAILGLGSGAVYTTLRQCIAVEAYEPDNLIYHVACNYFPHNSPLNQDPCITVRRPGEKLAPSIKDFIRSIGETSIIIADLGRSPQTAMAMTDPQVIRCMKDAASIAVMCVACHSDVCPMLSVIPAWQQVFGDVLTIKAGASCRVVIGAGHDCPKIDDAKWLPALDYLHDVLKVQGAGELEIAEDDLIHYGPKPTLKRGSSSSQK
ncbi:hypothetical protein DIPPA_26567 [Diplonema papillatum]|nr:hypothetical protein DIPPA_26567 [Diplonema papillatum]